MVAISSNYHRGLEVTKSFSQGHSLRVLVNAARFVFDTKLIEQLLRHIALYALGLFEESDQLNPLHEKTPCGTRRHSQGVDPRYLGPPFNGKVYPVYHRTPTGKRDHAED